jgi:flagellar hook-associated protein 3 FlgL
MSSRIASASSNARIVQILLESQRGLHELEVQVASQDKAQDYAGLALQSERLLGLQNKRDLLQQYNDGNDTVNVRLKTQANAVDVIQETIDQFRKDVNNFAQGNTSDPNEVALLQNSAFRSMQTLEAYLNTDVDGIFLFSGTRTTTESVFLRQSSLTNFQTAYDGSTITYPTTRDTAVHPRLTATTGFPTNPTGAGFTDLTFANPNTITAATAGSFANIPVGTTFTIAGAAAAANNGTFTVATNDGTTMTVTGTTTPNFTAAANDAGPTMAIDSSYYRGDETAFVHRVDSNQQFTNALNAIDPAFEKAFRAMGLLAQGAFGTAGGLDQNLTRVDQAKYLIQSSLYSTVQGVPPFGTEQAGSMQELQSKLGFNQVLIKRTNESNSLTASLLDDRVGKIAQVDLLTAITAVTDASRNLEASYQAIARIRSLNLQDFLR